MPQLNPSPWFWILVMSWVAFLMFFPKTNKLKMPEEPFIKNNKYSLNPWNWPWI